MEASSDVSNPTGKKKRTDRIFPKGISKEALRLSLTNIPLSLILEFHFTDFDEAPDQLKKKFKVQWLQEPEDADFLVENASGGVFPLDTKHCAGGKDRFVSLKKSL